VFGRRRYFSCRPKSGLLVGLHSIRKHQAQPPTDEATSHRTDAPSSVKHQEPRPTDEATSHHTDALLSVKHQEQSPTDEATSHRTDAPSSVKQQEPRPTDEATSQRKYAQPSKRADAYMRIGDRIVWMCDETYSGADMNTNEYAWISDSEPEHGTVKWIGLLPEAKSDRDLTVGVEFVSIFFPSIVLRKTTICLARRQLCFIRDIFRGVAKP